MKNDPITQRSIGLPDSIWEKVDKLLEQRTYVKGITELLRPVIGKFIEKETAEAGGEGHGE